MMAGPAGASIGASVGFGTWVLGEAVNEASDKTLLS